MISGKIKYIGIKLGSISLIYEGKMSYIYTPYIIPYIGTLAVNLFMIFYVFKNRHRKGVMCFILTIIFSCLWCAGTAMEISSPNLELKVLWSKIGFPAYTFGPLFWTIMVLQMIKQDFVISKRIILLMCIIPILTVIFVWTNDYHGLIWSSISMKTAKPFSYLIVKHGTWFWVHAIYSDGLNLTSVLLSIRFWRDKESMYSNQFKYLTFSMLFIMIVNVAYVFRIGPSFDMTSIAWGISSLFLTWALFRKKLFDIVPIARDRVMESMTDGIVIIDIEGRIADINPSAQNFLRCRIIETIGKDAIDFFDNWPYIKELVLQEKEHSEFEYIVDKELFHYDASCLPIKNERGSLLGKLLIIRDITQKKITERELLIRQQQIAIKEEREKMARDLHDNIGQILGFVNVQTQAISEYIKHDQLQNAMQCLERLTDVAQEAHNSVRQTIIAMRGEKEPEANRLSGFFIELEKRTAILEQRYGIKIEIEYKKVKDLEAYGSKVLSQLSNIIKESLNNIIKHSSASIVNMVFEEDEEGFHLCITDNGNGFDVKKVTADNRSKYGLLFMSERAEEIGGCLYISSVVGKGTKIEIKIPSKALEI